jgi:hypothetical protein
MTTTTPVAGVIRQPRCRESFPANAQAPPQTSPQPKERTYLSPGTGSLRATVAHFISNPTNCMPNRIQSGMVMKPMIEVESTTRSAVGG